MPQIDIDTVYKRALIRINDLDLANMVKEDFYESISGWLQTFISAPIFRKQFKTFSINEEIGKISFSLNNHIDDFYDGQFVTSVLSKGLIVNYFPSKLEETSHLAVMIGGKEEKKLLDNYGRKMERLDQLRKEVELEITQHGYYFGDYEKAGIPNPHV